MVPRRVGSGRSWSAFLVAFVAVLLVAGCASSGGSASGSAGPTSVSVSSLKLPFTPHVIPYGGGGAQEADVAPPAPAGGNGGATAPGVTATTITVGQLMSLSGLAPGVFQGVVDAAKAYANYVNSLGGVYGRKIQINVGDDAFDIVKDQAVCSNLVPQVFALVSDLATADTGCYPLMRSSGIPVVGPIVFDPRTYLLPNAFVPPPYYYSNLQGALELALHPDVKKVWLCEQDIPGIAAQAAPEQHMWESLGIQVVQLPPLSSTAPDYTAAVVKARSAGAQAVDCFSTNAQVSAQIAKAMAQQGWDPPIKQGFAVYDKNFLALAGSAANGWSVSVQVPALDANEFTSTPTGQLYQHWVGKLPQTLDDYFGWEYMDLFVQALVKAGPNVTRAGLLAALGTFHQFSAHGLVPPFDVGAKGPNATCEVLVRVANGRFEQVLPGPNQLVCGGKFFS